MLLNFSGLLILSDGVLGLSQENIVPYVLDTYIGIGFKGFCIIGVMAMLMSTADSYINTSSILFSHDFCKSIGIELTEQKELFLSRISALIIGTH